MHTGFWRLQVRRQAFENELVLKLCVKFQALLFHHPEFVMDQC